MKHPPETKPKPNFAHFSKQPYCEMVCNKRKWLAFTPTVQECTFQNGLYQNSRNDCMVDDRNYADQKTGVIVQ